MKLTVSKSRLIIVPDVLIAGFLLYLVFEGGSVSHVGVTKALAVIAGYIILRSIAVVWSHKRIFQRIETIVNIIADYKKGKFASARDETIGKDDFSLIIKELALMGKHFEDLVFSQKSEIENLRELYHNIVLSISSYFLVLNYRSEVIFANESFCRKFQFELEDIVGRNIQEIFFFLTDTIKESIGRVSQQEESIVLEKTHLVSINKISVIADIKISTMAVKGESQIIFVIDDVTSKCRKDFQISLISQVSESIQRDDEIERVLHTILTGVTSGSGLGFNRAMLFLLDDRGNTLEGKMAVGPDNIDEAIEIWGTVPNCGVDIYTQLKSYDDRAAKGKGLLERVQQARFPVGGNNILVQPLANHENIHVYDAYGDDRVDDSLREFMDVREYVIVPLIAVNRAIGVIVADNKFNQVPIGNDNIELLSIFAFQAAISIESYKNLHLIKKEMEKIKERQDAMIEQEKLAAVGRIALHIAHEIRNPLVTMGGYARRILQLSKDNPKNGESVSKAAAVVLKESERLEKTLSNVMDFTKSASFIMEYNNINDIVEDTCELMKNLLQEKHIHLRMKLDENTPLVKSDFNQLKQVMLNLIQNAIDATPAHGEIELETKTNANHVLIDVRDTGSGIDSENISRVFEPFFTTKITGVGLGLSIVKKIITDHNGEISVKRRPEGGTEFRISLKIPG